jgi:drug/metabolite transporter (DMT)-like permease
MSIAPILIAILSTFSFSCLDASLGYLTNVLNIPITQIILLRTVSTFLNLAHQQGAVCLLCLAYLAYTRPVDAPFGPAKVRHLIWMRAVMLTTGLFLGYSSLHYLTLAEYLTLYCLNPLFTAWACWMFAGEPVTRTQTVCCCELPLTLLV